MINCPKCASLQALIAVMRQENTSAYERAIQSELALAQARSLARAGIKVRDAEIERIDAERGEIAKRHENHKAKCLGERE